MLGCVTLHFKALPSTLCKTAIIQGLWREEISSTATDFHSSKMMSCFFQLTFLLCSCEVMKSKEPSQSLMISSPLTTRVPYAYKLLVWSVCLFLHTTTYVWKVSIYISMSSFCSKLSWLKIQPGSHCSPA